MMKKALAKAAALACAAGLMVTGCGINQSATLIDINGGKDKITLGYGYFVARVMQADYDSVYRSYYGDKYWSQDQGDGKTLESTVKEELVTMMEEQYLYRTHAADYGVKISDAEQKKIDKAAKKFMKDNSDDAIRELGATEEYAKQMMEDQYYSYYVTRALQDEADTTVTDEEAAQKTFSYVKFSLTKMDQTTGQNLPLTDDEEKEAKTNAQTLATSASFDETAAQLGATVLTSAYGKSDIGDDSYSMSQDILKALEKLSVGQVSDVITVPNDGYYVVRLDSEFDQKATDTRKEELAEQKKQDHAKEVMDGWKKEAKFKLDRKQWKKVRFDSLFETKQTTSDSAR